MNPSPKEKTPPALQSTSVALDIVILPPAEIMDHAISINQEHLLKSQRKISLNRDNCFPHISLSMGCAAERDVPKIQAAIDETVKNFKTMKLEIVKTYSHPLMNNEIISGFEIKKTEAIQALHEALVHKMKAFFKKRAYPDMFYQPPAIDEITVQLANRFLQQQALENYNPHLTLGLGIAPQLDQSYHFTASSITLCRLGNYCTCRKVLSHHAFNSKTAGSR